MVISSGGSVAQTFVKVLRFINAFSYSYLLKILLSFFITNRHRILLIYKIFVF